MAHHRDITVSVEASGPDDLIIVVSSIEVEGRAEISETTWEFTIPKDVWKLFMTLAPGFTRTVRIHENEES